MDAPEGSRRRGEGDVPRLAAVAEEMDRHEELLRAGAPAACVSVARARAVSVGVAVRPEAGYLDRARKEGIPVVRRTTGGTGVLHLEGDLLWAVVLPRSDARVGHDFARAFGRLGTGIVAGLAAVGVRSGWVPAPGLSDDCCPLSSRGEVLAARGWVLGGAAQHATSRALLHHGGISWNVDRACVDRLFGLPAGGPSSRLGGLAELVAVSEPATVAEALERALNEQLRP